MITKDDLIKRFGKQELVALTDKDGLSVMNETVLNTAIADAVALVASYLGASYLGVGAANPILIAKTCDIARFYLHDDNVTETVKLRYDEAIAWLKEAKTHPDRLGIQSGHIAVMTNPVPNLWADSPLNQDNDPIYY